MLARVGSDSTGGLNRRYGGFFGDDTSVDQVEDSDAVLRQVWIPLYCYEEPQISVRRDEPGSSFLIGSGNKMRLVPDDFEAFLN